MVLLLVGLFFLFFVIVIVVVVIGGSSATARFLLDHFMVAQAGMAVLGARRTDRALAGAPRLPLATSQASEGTRLARLGRTGGVGEMTPQLQTDEGRQGEEAEERRRHDSRGVDSSSLGRGPALVVDEANLLGCGGSSVGDGGHGAVERRPQQRCSMVLRCRRAGDSLTRLLESKQEPNGQSDQSPGP